MRKSNNNFKRDWVLKCSSNIKNFRLRQLLFWWLKLEYFPNFFCVYVQNYVADSLNENYVFVIQDAQIVFLQTIISEYLTIIYLNCTGIRCYHGISLNPIFKSPHDRLRNKNFLPIHGFQALLFLMLFLFSP